MLEGQLTRAARRDPMGRELDPLGERPVRAERRSEVFDRWPERDGEGRRRDHLPPSPARLCALRILPVGSRDVG